MASQDISKKIYSVATAPLWHSGRTLQKNMLQTLLALLPVIAMAVYRYGYDAVEVMAWAGLTAIVTEALVQKIMKQAPTSDDFSALVDGLLFAFLLPATAPVWMVVIGSAIMIILGRMVFGGYGGSPICAPALGWAVLAISWPDFMDLNGMLLKWDLIEPLSDLKYFGLDAISSVTPMSLLLGENLGALGASQALMVLIGGVYLLSRGVVRWFIPVSFLAGVILTGTVYNLIDPQHYASPLFHLLSGSTLLAAFFLMPYPSSSPAWRLPMLLFGFFGGVMVIIIRTYGVYPDGVPFAILLANLCTPLFDLIQPKPFGGR
ncbi:RnfABCDGE type electron transport complex subunit D [Desulfomicrobium baculatum]|uniref:Electron transport complex, RnfABCDGE type, D subunit n=1 Tax=Desulfomicrobium baculatum (strain DSM 4028 / VKM B-1378 / X) TaxID=525897 RepID=C7LXH6_DESBD|nr:RnfABCDGE type electron transport complex subunit D [Desulfomicrobium baculatum]ACU90047.1 electron transport complex, RnfABCDGE type, D subunit [Desulfomicrobium baculatum DSM 4028]